MGSLSDVSRLFDQFRNPSSDTLSFARSRIAGTAFGSSGFGKFSKYSDFPPEEFDSCLKEYLGEELHACLTKEQAVGAVLQQLSRGLRKVDEETTNACWTYWLREDVKPVAALIIVDVQNDFITGSLALTECPSRQNGGEVVPVINELLFKNLFPVVVYTKDWHPPDHISFLDNVKLRPIHPSSQVDAEHAKVYDIVTFDYDPVVEQELWPRHCEMNSPGAELHKDLKAPYATDVVVTKGSNSDVDSYSAFWDNNASSNTELFVKLVEQGVTHTVVCGLALDVCVQFTAVHSVDHGFKTFVVKDASRGVTNEDIAKALENFETIGATVMMSNQVPKILKELE